MASIAKKLSYRVNEKTHRAISIAAIAFISFIGLEALVYINNLYQIRIYVITSVFVYHFLVVWLLFIFDHHFRLEFAHIKGLLPAMLKRFEHVLRWEHFRHFQNYLILPGILYWGAVVLIGINFGHHKLQQFVAVVTGVALTIVYSFFKTIFKNKEMPINDTHFIILSYVKIYAAWLIYSASLGVVWYYCLSPNIFYMSAFLFTLMLLWQAAFQFATLNLRSLAYIVGISVIVAIGSSFVFKLWNVNYFSAGLFLAAVYNLFWGLLFHKFKKSFNAEVVIEQLLIFILFTVLVLGITDFHAKIQRCWY